MPWSTIVCSSSYHVTLQLVEYLLDRGADVNATDDGGWTALMHAAEGGHLRVAEILVRNLILVRAGRNGTFGIFIFCDTQKICVPSSMFFWIHMEVVLCV